MRGLPDDGQLLGGIPLVVAVGGQDRAPALEGPAVGRLLRDRLHPGVDHPAAHLGVLGPERHQPPGQHPQLPLGGRVLLAAVLVPRAAARRRRRPPWSAPRCSRARGSAGQGCGSRTPRRGPQADGSRRSDHTCAKSSGATGRRVRRQPRAISSRSRPAPTSVGGSPSIQTRTLSPCGSMSSTRPRSRPTRGASGSPRSATTTSRDGARQTDGLPSRKHQSRVVGQPSQPQG